MKIRITGSAGECDRLLARLAQVVGVREVSGFYPNRAPSALGRVYLDVDLVELAGPTVRASAERSDRPARPGPRALIRRTTS